MSSNDFTITCLADEQESLVPLHHVFRHACETEEWPSDLQHLADDWSPAWVNDVQWRGNSLHLLIQGSSGSMFESWHAAALHARGAKYVRVRIYHGQTDDVSELFYRAGEPISRRQFPAVQMSEREEIQSLVLDGEDVRLATRIKAGASLDIEVDGQPLILKLLEYGLEKSIKVALARGIDLSPCLVDLCEFARLIVIYGGKQRASILRSLLDLTPTGAALLWQDEDFMARAAGYLDLLELLIEHGADVNASISEQGSLLFDSDRYFGSQPRILAFLRKHNAQSIPPAADQ